MKKLFTFIFFTGIHFCIASAQDAKIVSDCTVSYDVTVTDSKADPAIIKAMSGSTKILYVKGSKTRSDLITPTFTQTTLYDSRTDSTVILRQLGTGRYISYLNENKKKEQNNKYEGIEFTDTDEKKTILGYECKQVTAKLTNGFVYNVFYAKAIIPSNKLYEYQFKDLPGLVLEYEAQSEDGKTRIKYAASKINFVPVPDIKFDIPKTGYRVL